MKQSFQQRLEKGEEIEYAILGIIKKKYPKAYKISGYYPDYDLYVPEKKMGVEVKYDSNATQTGNYLIDIEHNGKPHGLATTKAHLWVIWDNVKLLYIPPQAIWECIKENNIEIKELNGNSMSDDVKKIYLIPCNMLKKYDYLSGQKKFITKVRKYFPADEWQIINTEKENRQI